LSCCSCTLPEWWNGISHCLLLAFVVRGRIRIFFTPYHLHLKERHIFYLGIIICLLL
jgi:hypothetical protein